MGRHEPSGQTLSAKPKFNSLQTMLGGYKVNICGAFWRRAAPHSRTCPVTPGARALRRRWGGQARVQRLAVGEIKIILPPKRMHWDQGDIVANAYPGLLRLLRPPGGGRARARARVAYSGPHPDIIFERGEGFYSTQINSLGVLHWAVHPFFPPSTPFSFDGQGNV